VPCCCCCCCSTGGGGSDSRCHLCRRSMMHSVSPSSYRIVWRLPSLPSYACVCVLTSQGSESQ
jgi:hypothetical protein